MDIEDILANPAFWILGGGAVAMELIGFIAAKRMGWGTFPIWQFLILIVGTIIIAAVFANQD